MNNELLPIILTLVLVAVLLYIVSQMYLRLVQAYEEKSNELTAEVRMHAETDRALHKATEMILELESQLNKKQETIEIGA